VDATASSVLAQYGALGVTLVLAFAAIRILFGLNTKALDRERERADRMESEVARLNGLIQDKMLPTLHDATKVLSQVLEQQQRRRDRSP
jgi:hypothetical protein